MSDRFVSWEEAVAWLLAQPGKADLARDCYYDGTPLEAAARYHQSEEWLATRKLLPKPSGNALDVGAGRGIASYALARDGWRVTALEPAPGNLVGSGAIRAIAQSARLPIEVIEEFGEHIPLEAEAFDLIFARQALHHARDLPRFCAELFRLLKPGGAFIAVRDHVISSAGDLAAFLRNHPLHELYGGENAFTLLQYREALRKAGFVIQKTLYPFDSVINYAPHTTESLKAELRARLNRFPLGSVAGRLLDSKAIMNIALHLLSHTDRRPGRLFSFICRKP